ncbi:MAG: lysylphosphatidylglycerol synthase domain-containing protein [Ilumatobacteraceae bacterium]
MGRPVPSVIAVPRPLTVLRALLVLAAVTWIVLEFRSAAADSGSASWPSPGRLALAAVCVAMTLLCAALNWAALVGVGRRAVLVRGFLIAQLGKYVPGGVVQLVGQADSARRAGAAPRSIAVALPVHALSTTVGAGAVAAIGLAVAGAQLTPSTRLSLGVAGAAVSAVVLSRGGAAFLLARLHRRWPRVPDGSVMPSRRAVAVAVAVGCVGSACYGAAFVLIADVPGAGPAASVALGAAFVVAFTLGFLVVPMPAGLGVREAALVVLLEPYASPATVLAASIGLRIVQLVVEIAVSAIAGIAVRVGGVT